MDRSEYQKIFEEVRRNRKRLDNCTRHEIDPPKPYKLGMKLTCKRCAGQIDGPELLSYVRGYAAAGGNPDDVWPGISAEMDEAGRQA